tara:strand:+ start:29 stop:445 length:417 start_codon:yes stop_codon:yes gene_type:complete
MARTKRNNKTKRVRNKKGHKTKRRTRRTRRNRQRGGKSLREYMSSARDKIRGSFQKLRERFTGNGNQPVSSQDETKRLRDEMRKNTSNGISNISPYQDMRRDANKRAEKLRNVEERSQEMVEGSSNFLATAKKLSGQR